MTYEDLTTHQAMRCIAFARDFYYAHCDFHGIDTTDRPFAMLSRVEKDHWIKRAVDVMQDVPPPSKVIATITPDAPWGISA